MRHVNAPTAWERASEFFVTSRQSTRNQASRARRFIARKPALSMLLGVGAGLLVGLLFRKAPQVVLVLKSKERTL
jgi:hypothetical protein